LPSAKRRGIYYLVSHEPLSEFVYAKSVAVTNRDKFYLTLFNIAYARDLFEEEQLA
jgi:hypothetical protein